MASIKDLLVASFGEDVVRDYFVQVMAAVSATLLVGLLVLLLEPLRRLLGSLRRRRTPLETAAASSAPQRAHGAMVPRTDRRQASARAYGGSRGSTPVIFHEPDGPIIRSITLTGTTDPPKHWPSSPDLLRTAAAKNFYPVECELCRGDGQTSTPDMNSPGGRKLRDPCPLCDGTGRAWINGPGIRPRLSDAQVLALDSSAAHKITSTDAQVEAELREIMTRHAREGVTPWRPHQQERFRIQRRRELRSK